MRYFVFVTIICFLPLFARAQKALTDQLKNPVGFISEDYHHPKFYYGIRNITQDVKSLQGVFLQTYEIIYEIGYVRSTTSVKKPQIFLGFYGVDFAKITDWEPMKCKPTDTVIQPCVHNLLSDVVINSADQLGIDNIANCELLVFNIFNDKSLFDLLNEKKQIPEYCKGIFYLLWNKENKPELPSFLSSESAVRMAINNPVKVPRKTLAFMETVSARQEKPVETDQPEKKSDEKPAVTNAKKDDTKPPPDVTIPLPPAMTEKTGVSPKEQSNQDSGTTTIQNNRKHTANSKPAGDFDSVYCAPLVSPGFMTDIVSFLAEKKIVFNQEENDMSLSKNNDTIYIWAKSQKKLLNTIVLKLTKTPVVLRQNEDNYRVSMPDPESRILNHWNVKKMIFAIKGQKLFFDNLGQKLFIPELVSSASDIRITSGGMTRFEIAETSSDTINAYVTYQKLPTRITILDAATTRPIKDCPVRIIIKKKFETIQVNEEICSYFIDSGDELTGLYKHELIKYIIILDHPDYKQVTQLLTDKEIGGTKTLYLEKKPSFALVYVEPELMMREQIVNSLDKRKESLCRNSTQFLLYISNTDRPMVVSDSSLFTSASHQIAMLYDDKPNLEVDYQALVNHMKNVDVSKDSIVVTFYMSASLYRKDGKTFIDRLVKDMIGLIYNKEPEIYIFTDAALNNDEKIDEIKYHYYNILK